MSPSTNGDDNKVVEFPKTAEERKALRKAKQDLERQQLIAVFVDEAGADQALFRTYDGVAYADLIIAGHRETWPIRSKQFRFEYIRYLRRQLESLTDKGAVMALALGPSLKKAAVNAAIDEFEMRAICSQVEREVHVRVASDGDDLYIDLCDHDWHAVRSHGGRMVGCPISTSAIPTHIRDAAAALSRARHFPRCIAAISEYQRKRFRPRGRFFARCFAAAWPVSGLRAYRGTRHIENHARAHLAKFGRPQLGPDKLIAV